MVPLKERYVIDENGNRVAVMLPMEEYQRLLEERDLLESIRAYDAAKASHDGAIPFEEFVAEIEHTRGSRRKFERALAKGKDVEPEPTTPFEEAMHPPRLGEAADSSWPQCLFREGWPDRRERRDGARLAALTRKLIRKGRRKCMKRNQAFPWYPSFSGGVRSGRGLRPFGRFSAPVKAFPFILLLFFLAVPAVAQEGPIAPPPPTLQGGGSSDLETYKEANTGMEFVRVKGGCYPMGDTLGDGNPNERPIHEVCVGDFCLGRYEVTVGQFRRFVDATGYRTEAERGDGALHLNEEGWLIREAGTNWQNPGYPQTDRHPVVCVSWNDCQAFLEWLSGKTGKAFRLPTEAEWEYAARSGGKSYEYSWGDGDPSGNIVDESAKRKFPLAPIWWRGYDDDHVYPAPVGSFSPNELGLFDMTGNVWEWCQDWYGKDYYERSPKDNPTGPDSGTHKIARGGSWYSVPRNVRIAYRFRGWPSERLDGNGFRVALPLR